MLVNIGVAAARVSNRADAVLVTHSLGSCVGVAAYDSVARVGGLLHYQLPSSTLAPQKAAARPAMFADTGFSWLMAHLAELGGRSSNLVVVLAGAASVLNDRSLFDVGRRNYAAIRAVLRREAIPVEREEVGGVVPRTMYLSIADGTVSVRSRAAPAPLK